MNALQFVSDAMQEVGLRKGDFNESRVAKKEKETQPSLDGNIGKAYFGTFTDIKDPSEKENDETEANNENIVKEDNNETLEDEKFGLRDIIDYLLS